MKAGRVPARGVWMAALACAGAVAGCATAASTGAFVPIDRLEQELRRGISTKMDTQRVLGTPKGYGAMRFPEDHRELEVWYYDDMALTGVQTLGEGRIRADMRQQVLLVTFDKEVFDGFIWFTNAGQVREK